MSEPRAWYFYIDGMINFAQKALEYSNGLGQAGFFASGINYDATLRNLELIGEAVTRIPKEVQEVYSEIFWRQIVATRNRLIHGYLGMPT